MIGWPLYRLGKALHKRGRLPDMKPVRVAITSCVVALLLLGFFFLPLPVSRVRETGLVQVQPDHIEKVSVEIPGRLVRFAVVEGQQVKKGMVLAEFESHTLEEGRLRATSDVTSQQKLTRDSADPDPRPKKEDRDSLMKRLTEGADGAEEGAGGTRRADGDGQAAGAAGARDGVVMGLPRKDELFKTWEPKNLEQAFCQIGDPHKLRVLVPIGPADYDVVLRDDADMKRGRRGGRGDDPGAGWTAGPGAGSSLTPRRRRTRRSRCNSRRAAAAPSPYGPRRSRTRWSRKIRCT